MIVVMEPAMIIGTFLFVPRLGVLVDGRQIHGYIGVYFTTIVKRCVVITNSGNSYGRNHLDNKSKNN